MKAGIVWIIMGAIACGSDDGGARLGLGTRVQTDRAAYAVGDIVEFHGEPIVAPKRSDALVYNWSLESAPTGNQSDIEPEQLTPRTATLEVNVPGEYVVQLMIDSKVYGPSEPDQATINVYE